MSFGRTRLHACLLVIEAVLLLPALKPTDGFQLVNVLLKGMGLCLHIDASTFPGFSVIWTELLQCHKNNNFNYLIFLTNHNMVKLDKKIILENVTFVVGIY